MRTAGFVIAIDGPAASGKGTISSRLGTYLGFPVMDTGLLYRGVGMAARRRGIDPGDAETLAAVAASLATADFEDPELRGRSAGEAASQVAVHAPVRAALLDLQRQFASQEPGAILDGRDIGTIIAPRAQAKLFVTATPEIRAERRWKQLADQGEAVNFEDVLADIRLRDERDSSRGSAPLAKAEDAVLLDTTKMDIDQAFDAARRIVDTARARWTKLQG